MAKNFKRNLVKITIFLGIIFAPYVAFAQWVLTGPSSLTDADLSVILENIIIGFLQLVALVGIVYLVYGGIRYVTSAGNESDAEEAKKTITYAIWGLFLVAAAYAIVRTIVAIVG